MIQRNNQITASVLFLLASGGLPAMAEAASGDMDIEGIVARPTCSVTAPANYDLGVLDRAPAAQMKPAFNIVVNCPARVSSWLWSEVKRGLATTTTGYMEINGQVLTGNTAARFFLYYRPASHLSELIYLDGTGENDPVSGFCAGTGSRTCTMEPAVWHSNSTEVGSIAITVGFNLKYN